ncbi:outer membrane receptor protein involved in Fe transport [Luteibacter jiangsuensis]|uniref:Outer membrane receptor protein involved in Fe transport n=1 Tax=Luteibacter jiangsuensis TaxID=637577 RepID=A0ABT9SX18_9GAMM|nr:TonB-dependent receptor [Luteibacter jiangsuensis]MDQ0009544.1 outer membrane receptor protein involved in Fe transport [Luteibacter jiangsuensis]
MRPFGACAATALATSVANAVDRVSVNLPVVTVVAVAPGLYESRDARTIPYDTRWLDRHDTDPTRSTGLADALDRDIPGISLNAVQGNPWQPDLQYRGYTASPLLGTPQGLAIYQDGVRVNEVFGDTVNWDLIPSRAVDGATLSAGASPVFGQNALGGAIDLRTKTGFSAPGTRIGRETGSFGRETSFLESGGNDGGLGYYVLGDRMDERGWRDLSPSHARHSLGAFSFRGDRLDLDLHLAQARTDLTGNGASPAELLRQRRAAIFTAPDETSNRLSQASLTGTWRLTDRSSLIVTAFTRRVRTRSYNGDTSEYAACNDDASILCGEDGRDAILDARGTPVSSRYDAIANLGMRRQRARGGSAVLHGATRLFGRDNTFFLGVDERRGSVGYTSEQRVGLLDEARHVAADGPAIPSEAVAVHATTRDRAAFVSDRLRLSSDWTLDLAARFNRTRVSIADRSGRNRALDGGHTFSRFNPSVGLSWLLSRRVSAFASYSESTRAPTPVELTCADEEAPCRLPNDFVSDPPLKQVVARSVEAGLRGGGAVLHWDASLYRSTSAHDIVFQTTGGGLSNRGFFANVGDTRREGVQASLRGRWAGIDWHMAYAYLRARFLSGFDQISAHHPDADADGVVTVKRGDDIPGLPRHMLKVGADWSPTPVVTFGIDGRFSSGQYLRGDEINALGKTGGYALFDLDAHWQVTPRVQISARVENLLDRRYVSFGVLGNPSSVLPGLNDPRFLGPGAPRAGWLSITLSL